jgi:hypothetical protein
VEIDSVLDFPLLVRNPNFVGWDFHLRHRGRDRSTSADEKGLVSQGVGVVDFSRKIGVSAQTPMLDAEHDPGGR